jgi:hypothetical protein
MVDKNSLFESSVGTKKGAYRLLPAEPAEASAFPAASLLERSANPVYGTAGLASESKIDQIPYREDSLQLAAGNLQSFRTIRYALKMMPKMLESGSKKKIAKVYDVVNIQIL